MTHSLPPTQRSWGYGVVLQGPRSSSGVITFMMMWIHSIHCSVAFVHPSFTELLGKFLHDGHALSSCTRWYIICAWRPQRQSIALLGPSKASGCNGEDLLFPSILQRGLVLPLIKVMQCHGRCTRGQSLHLRDGFRHVSCVPSKRTLVHGDS